MSMQTPTSAGIHHITAIASDAQSNVDFWSGLLGMRTVKKTVNFDDPETYHLYYGDDVGRPGTLLTFFPYKRARFGSRGRGQATAVALIVPVGSLDWWADRLMKADVHFERQTRFGEPVLAFEDPDGLPVELVGVENPGGVAWADGPVPAEHAVRGAHSVTLWVASASQTAEVLAALGFSESASESGRIRYITDAEIGHVVDIRETGNQPTGDGGAGTIHHVAFRVANDDEELAARKRVIDLGLRPTEVVERDYFRSVYFREPGGVLFEIATDPPGMLIDEPLETLGTKLQLPERYEPHRDQIEAGVDRLIEPQAEPAPVFVHRWEPAEGAKRTLLMLHGTGGDEFDLVPLAKKLDVSANVLSPRGRVNERGMARFFRRIAEGVFDEEDVVRQANALADWLAAQSRRRGFDASAVDAVGYSNGANIATAALLLRPESLRSLVLLRPMIPLDQRMPETLPDLSGKRILLAAGRQDAMIPTDQIESLRTLLTKAGADVTLHWSDVGHELTGEDLAAAQVFLGK